MWIWCWSIVGGSNNKNIKMKTSKLITDIIEELEIESVKKININQNLMDLDEWDSLNMLMLLDYIKTKFNVTLSPDNYKNELTIQIIINDIEKNSDIKIINDL